MNKILKISIAVVLCLIVILVAVLVFSQCSNNGNDDTTTTTTTPTTQSTTSSSSTSGNQGGDNPVCDEHVDANTDYVCDHCGEQLENPNGDYTETNDVVYVISAELNIRKTPDADGAPIASAFRDEQLVRLGYYANGWSKILYDDVECYAKTDFLTNQKPITEFEEHNETVYFLGTTIAYSKPSYIETEKYSEKMDTLFTTNVATLKGVAKDPYIMPDGSEVYFAKITYVKTVNGVEEDCTYYVNYADLTFDMPIELNPDGEITFEHSDKILVSTQEKFWLRKSTLFQDSEKLKVIPGGTILQAIGTGIEDDGTIWYKVVYEGSICYVIYQAPGKDPYFELYDAIAGSFEYLFGEYSITLSETFVIYDYDDKHYSITDAIHSIDILNTGSVSVSTIQEFALLLLDAMDLSTVQVQEKNGVTFFEFETSFTLENETTTVYTLVTFAAGSNNNYYVTTFSGIGEKAELDNIFWGYADTIVIAPPQ